MITIETNLGTIKIKLNHAQAPKTCENFVKYVESGFFDGTIFHRVIDNFMIQGGGFDENFTQKPTLAPIKNEAGNGLSNVRGTIAMARTNDPHSATSQFFINVKDNLFLDQRKTNVLGKEVIQDWGYCVFGEVVDGMDVVDKIKVVATHNRGYHADVPQENVVMHKVTYEKL